MSYRSALSNPTLSSGNVGQVILSAGTAPVSLLNSGVIVIDTITLGAGVWHITTGSSVSITGATMTTLKTAFSSVTITYMSATKVQQTLTPNTTTTTNPYIFSDSDVITLTAPTVLNYTGYALYSGGTVIASPPDTTSQKYITATKLA
jgi:hypothetical protein